MPPRARAANRLLTRRARPRHKYPSRRSELRNEAQSCTARLWFLAGLAVLGTGDVLGIGPSRFALRTVIDRA